jgi:hypothetical protein
MRGGDEDGEREQELERSLWLQNTLSVSGHLPSPALLVFLSVVPHTIALNKVVAYKPPGCYNIYFVSFLDTTVGSLGLPLFVF